MHEIVPLTTREGYAYLQAEQGQVNKWRRTVFALGYVEGDAIAGALVAGETDPMLCDGWTLEVCAAAGSGQMREGLGILLEAAWAAAQGLGYRRMLLGSMEIYRADDYDGGRVRPTVVVPRGERKVDWESAMGGKPI